MKNETIEPFSKEYRLVFEWPTWLLIFLVYGSWLLLLAYYHQLEAAVAMPLLVIVCVLHGSMCHELIHGHPTPYSWFNRLLGCPPLTLFLPYAIYRDTHIQHHQDENITLPGVDPESYYCSAAEYERKSLAGKAFAWINMTIAGRLLLSPAVEIWSLLKQLLAAIVSLNANWLRAWFIHLFLVVLLLMLVVGYFEVPWWHYLLVAYFASALSRIRSFYEHRARIEVSERTVLMDTCWFFRLMFLNLNYHLAHHEHPSIPWYRLANYYRSHRPDLIRRSGNFYYRGYRFWLLRYLVRPVDSPVHPFA